MNPRHLKPISFNGINGSTGQPLLRSLTLKHLAKAALGETWKTNDLIDLQEHQKRQQDVKMRPVAWVAPDRLDQTGWAVIFPHNQCPAIREALEPILRHRQAAAEKQTEGLFRILTYRPGETKVRFLARHKVGPGPVDPQKVPYYLLLVGDPEEIPFSFQSQLSVQYAVGRLGFTTPEEYAAYARSVIDAETSIHKRPRKASFVAVTHPTDNPSSSTSKSRRLLVEPLADAFEKRASRAGWGVERVYGSAATKSKLTEVFASCGQSSNLIFSASHGLGFSLDDPQQEHRQGALLCRDWPGVEKWRGGEIPQDHYLAADDISDQSSVAGKIFIFFSCYSAGTPSHDSFTRGESPSDRIAARNFLSRLPQRLLAHPRGGALAVVGHVDRAWSYSFEWPRAGSQLGAFESTLVRLLQGQPLGAAMDDLGSRYAELATELSSQIEAAKIGQQDHDLLTLAGLWTAHNDARSYVLLGDPAVRLTAGESK